MQEYDPQDSSTWTVMPASSVDPSFMKGLIEIGGLNPHGRPMLELRWGATYVDPQSVDNHLKYWLADTEPVLSGFVFEQKRKKRFVTRLEEVPRTVLIVDPQYESHQLGERRFIVEIWRSPEFLKRTGRYQHTFDGGQVSTHFRCRNCGEFVPAMPETVNLDIPRQCLACGSKRVSPVDEREDGFGQLLRPIPPEGCYDFFFRLERLDGTYHPPDGEALEGVRRLWETHKRSFNEKDADMRATREKEKVDARRRRREIWHPDNLYRKQEQSA